VPKDRWEIEREERIAKREGIYADDSYSSEDECNSPRSSLKKPENAVATALYGLPVFMPAGRHTYVVKSPDKSYSIHRLMVPVRTEEIPIVVRPSKNKEVVERKFRKETSVFREWKEDTPLTFEKLSELDRKQWKAPRFIKDEDEEQACWDVIVKYMPILKEIHIYLASNSTFPAIG
jgi:hypothetical protein